MISLLLSTNFVPEGVIPRAASTPVRLSGIRSEDTSQGPALPVPARQ